MVEVLLEILQRTVVAQKVENVVIDAIPQRAALQQMMGELIDVPTSCTSSRRSPES